MTEQEFRELTAYQPPAPPKSHSPAVSAVAAAVAAAGSKPVASPEPTPATPPYPPAPEASAQPQQVDTPPPPPLAPTPVEFPPQNQFISQIHEQPVTPPPPPPPAPPAPAPMPVPQPQTLPSEPPTPSQTAEMVPLQKHEELMAQFERLRERYRRIVEERDSLSRQITELKRTAAEQTQAGTSGGSDYREEIRLLGKLIDDEQSLRKAAIESGAFRHGEDPYARHDRLVNVFLNIVGKSD